jgi:hypothetical protein
MHADILSTSVVEVLFQSACLRRDGAHQFEIAHAGTVRQQDHWLADFWPRHSSLHAVVAAHATAVREAPTAAEPSAPKTSRSPRQSFDRQRDLPLPDEPTTPAQRREGPFLDAASSSIDSADSVAYVPGLSEAAAPAEQVAQPVAEAQSQPAAELDTQPGSRLQQQQQQQQQLQQQEQQQPASPSSEAATDVSSASTDSFSRQAPGNVVISVLVPRTMSGWLIGPNGATAQQHQVPGARWFLADAKLTLGGSQDLRCVGRALLSEDRIQKPCIFGVTVTSLVWHAGAMYCMPTR